MLKDDVQKLYKSDQQVATIYSAFAFIAIQKLYKSDQQVATIYSAFAFIAIVISCLGLLGISLFDIRQRYREIAIRKVNGAMLKDLYVLLLRRYVGMLLLAAVVAVPLAWLAIHYYTADLVVKAEVMKNE